MSSTRNEDIPINQNITSNEYDSQFIGNFEPSEYSESSIQCYASIEELQRGPKGSEYSKNCYTSKTDIKCLRDPIDSRVTLVSILNLIII